MFVVMKKIHEEKNYHSFILRERKCTCTKQLNHSQTVIENEVK